MYSVQFWDGYDRAWRENGAYNTLELALSAQQFWEYTYGIPTRVNRRLRRLLGE